jgi:hypothetical protein
MENIFIPASFLSVAFSTESNLLKNDNHMYVIREAVTGNSSKLYRLFFGEQPQQLKKIAAGQNVSEPDYYSSYE